MDRSARRPARLQFYSQARSRSAPVKCVRHWFSSGGELAVQADGRVVPCCLAHRDEVVLGDLGTESLRDVWQGERFHRLRRALFTREGLADFAICERCNFDLL
jgi:radical SAM protein with 4Fe4S-binding SPASM domain